MEGFGQGFGCCPAVVPVLVGPLQVLLTILPGLLLALLGGLFALLKPSGMKNALVLAWRQKVAVAGVAVVAVGLYFGMRKVWPRAAAGIVTTSQLGADWPTARGGSARCGAVADSSSPTRDQLIWSTRPGDQGVLASPAVVGNRIYISTANRVISKSGAIYCLDADTGAVVWKSGPPDYRPTFSSPVVAGNYLVCGEGLHDTRDARVVCLDLSADGKVLWTFRTKNHVECTPVIAGGRVYVGAGDDGVYCLDLKPGDDGQAKLHWHKAPDQFPDAETALAVHDGRVYVGLGNDGSALVVLDAMSGAELHRLKMPFPVFSPPSIADGKLYVGMGNGDYVKPGEGGAVACVNLKSHKTEWTYELPKTVLGAVAVKDDKLYFGCDDGNIYCLSRTGKLIHQVPAFAPIKTSPAVTDTHIYVVTDGGLLFALERETMQPDWQFRLGHPSDENLFISSPVVARGHVYVGTEQEGVLCIGKPASTKRTPRWAAPLGGPGVAGNSDNSPIPDVGDVLWNYPAIEPKLGEAETILGPVAVWEDHIYAARTGAGEFWLECLTLDKERRQPPRLVWKLPTFTEIGRGPVVLGETVACVQGRNQNGERQVLFAQRGTGEFMLKMLIEPGASGILTATRHQFLVQDGVRRLASVDTRGIHQWSVDVGAMAHAPVANDALILATTTKPPHAVALDRATGAELWRMPLPNAPTATALLDGKTFLLPTSDGLEVRSLIDGSLLTSWKAELGIPSGELAQSFSQIVFVNQKGELVVFDKDAKRVAARVPGALPGQTPLVSRGKVVFAGEGRLMTFALGQENPTPELWADLSATAAKQGLPTGPLVLHDSRLLTVLPGRGLACLGGAK